MILLLSQSIYWGSVEGEIEANKWQYKDAIQNWKTITGVLTTKKTSTFSLRCKSQKPLVVKFLVSEREENLTSW
jgi:hypothetical protein